MLLYVIKQWKEKKITVMLLILGFLVGNLVLSVGTSVAVENVKMLEDQTSGNPDQQLEISVNQEEGAALKKEDWLAYCDKLTEYGKCSCCLWSQYLHREKNRLVRSFR